MVATLVTACGSSSAQTTPARSSTPSPTATPSATGTPAPSAHVTVHATVPTTGLKSASCVNGWTEPASPTDDFYKQAVAALQQSQGGGGYVVKSVRYFAGPLSGGGIGAIYYLKVASSTFNARVLLVSGAGPGQAAVATSTTSGWKAGDWKGFRGQAAAAAYPGLPGKWSGPEYDAVTGGLLAPGVAGCMAGT